MIYMKLFLHSQRKVLKLGRFENIMKLLQKKERGRRRKKLFHKIKSFEIERFRNIGKLLRKKRKGEKNDINEALSKRKKF